MARDVSAIQFIRIFIAFCSVCSGMQVIFRDFARDSTWTLRWHTTTKTLKNFLLNHLPILRLPKFPSLKRDELKLKVVVIESEATLVIGLNQTVVVERQRPETYGLQAEIGGE